MPRRHPFRMTALAACIAMLAGMLALAPTSSASSVTAAQTGPNPFDTTNVFCQKHTAPPGAKNTSSPGVTPSTITFSDTSLDVAALKRLAGVDQMDFDGAYKAYVDVINEQCGGINGRKIVFKKALYNVLAPDLQGHLQALCLKVTEDFKSLVNFGTGMPQIQRCVSINHKTLSMAAAETPAADYTQSSGRVFSRYPASDYTALAFIKDGAADQLFKGKKVGVLTNQIRATSTAQARDDYIDPLKKVGVDADLEVLPCTGNVCTAGITNAIRRFKDSGVNLMVVSTDVSVASIGAVMREMKAQNFRAQTWGPGIDALHSDSNMAGIVRAAGADAVAFMNDVGFYSVEFISRNGWRLGVVKETPYGKMCTSTLAKQLDQRQYQFNETDINSARWTGSTGICFSIQRLASAIWSLGNTVTTDRLAAALAKQKLGAMPDTQQWARTTQWYSGTNIRPAAVFTHRLNYPCPLPTRGPATSACMLSVDRPPRARVVKY
ncbi:MAG: hypothetical protein JWN67_645 [Actinomycetia bacterium]|nr:hypothetical protein [Actinomycetes bacterium]